MKAFLFYTTVMTVFVFITGLPHFIDLGIRYTIAALIMTATSVCLTSSCLTEDDVKKYSGYNLFNKILNIKDND